MEEHPFVVKAAAAVEPNADDVRPYFDTLLVGLYGLPFDFTAADVLQTGAASEIANAGVPAACAVVGATSARRRVCQAAALLCTWRGSSWSFPAASTANCTATI